jgi:hypothetical protein
MKKLIFLSLVILASCTPQQRLNRLIGKHPYLANSIVKDTTLTVFETDTVFIADRSIDTFFSTSVDTFTVTDSGVTVTLIKYIDRWSLKTVVKADTIIYKDTVKIAYKDTVASFTVEPVKTSDIWKWRKQGALWLLILIVLIIALITAIRIYIKGQIPFLKF